MAEIIRWGILGAGNIARSFARGLSVLPDAQLVAIGSRSQSSADTFGDEFAVPKRYSSYESLANDPEIDAVYIATPHPFHMENSLLCLDAGKAVLCEKPFTMNTRETETVIQRARQKGLFLMEAMWTRYIPAMRKVCELIEAGTIGEVRMLSADFGFRTNFDPLHRLFNPDLGGGALLDVGIYPISLASMLLGTPKHIQGVAHLGETGIDEQSAMLFSYEQGQIAQLSCAVRTTTPQEALIVGTNGMIKIHANWWVPQKFMLKLPNQPEQVFDVPMQGNGYNYEAAEVMRCLRAGELESPIMPLDETLAIMRTLDAIRALWGLTYPMERV